MSAQKIIDISCILEPTQLKGGLYLGNMDSASDINHLSKFGIKAILTICPQNIPQDVRSNYLVMHKQIVADDDDSYQIDRHFEECYQFIELARQRTNIMVHCQMGISRSATIVIAYLVKKELIGVREALKYVEQKRSQIFPNNGFLRQLGKYERSIFYQDDFKDRMDYLRESNKQQRKEISEQVFRKYRI